MTITDWETLFCEGLRAIRRPESVLTAPPAGPPTEDRLRALMTAWTQLALDDLSASPAITAGERFRRELTARLDYTEAAVRDVVAALDAEISRSLASVDAVAAHKFGIVRTADFGGPGVVIAGNLLTTTTDPHGVAVVGPMGRLPQDHPLRLALPANQWFRLDLAGEPTQPALILGAVIRPLAGPPVARAWYPLPAALGFTRQMRSVQLERERARDEEERLERSREAQERARWQESPEGQIAELKQRLAKLEAERDAERAKSKPGKRGAT